ncbi:helix-turn-helix domain-containing protein [Crenobacter sp. SG2305]|uniref:helix-turn-helix domain-containing protein n=1 Tax=Crenobacter oryzisoli TaxID=3056844 RepID=UPI0025AA6B59|nr:helix-turn-helix domain-containing protein [Crenobacter sp. SG2305]MDN0085419.1 helix-turn-helix domain-containing protein [Crenobacter sp. SG2305]
MKRKNARPTAAGTSANTSAHHSTATPPAISGQCAEVLAILRKHGAVLSFRLTAEHAIPEAAARIHDLRAKGYNIVTHIEPEIVYRGQVRRRVARYVLGTPAWPRPGFIADDKGEAA